MKTEYILLGALALLAGSACVKEDKDRDMKLQQQYLQLWIDTYYHGTAINNAGLYILEDKEGSGAAVNWGEHDNYIYADVTIRSLSGKVSSTTDEELAKQVGTFEKGNYYGPRFFKLGPGSSFAGVDALYDGMKLGGTRTAVIPSWMMTTARYNTQQEYLENMPSSSAHLIYTVKPYSLTEDPLTVQADSIRNYVERHYPNAQSAAYKEDAEADGSFYFYTDLDQVPLGEDGLPVERDSLASCTFNYTGRLLNGQVFDTTVERAAKDAGIYEAGKSYAPVSISYGGKWNDISMSGSSNLIDGFKGALSLIKFQGQKAVAIFNSTHGYGEGGSGAKIPAYSPLIFELELVSTSNDN